MEPGNEIGSPRLGVATTCPPTSHGGPLSSDSHGPAKIFATVWSNSKRLASGAASLPVVVKKHGGANTRSQFAQVCAQQIEQEPFQLGDLGTPMVRR